MPDSLLMAMGSMPPVPIAYDCGSDSGLWFVLGFAAATLLYLALHHITRR